MTKKCDSCPARTEIEKIEFTPNSIAVMRFSIGAYTQAEIGNIHRNIQETLSKRDITLISVPNDVDFCVFTKENAIEMLDNLKEYVEGMIE